MKKLSLMIMLIILLFNTGFAQERIIEGYIKNFNTNKPIEYANIGVIGKPYGTISNRDGSFLLKIDNSISNEKLNFSFLGFENQVVDIAKFKNNSTVFLREGIEPLKEVVISSQILKSIKLGSSSTNKRIVTGWYNDVVGQGKAGGQRGILIDNKQKKYLIKNVNFHIADNTYDSLYVRIHVKKLINNQPATSLLNKSIIISVKIKSGWVSADLSEHNLLFDEPIVVALEWIKVFGKSNTAKTFYLSGNILRGKMFYTNASDDVWMIKKNFSPSIYINVNEVSK